MCTRYFQNYQIKYFVTSPIVFSFVQSQIIYSVSVQSLTTLTCIRVVNKNADTCLRSQQLCANTRFLANLKFLKPGFGAQVEFIDLKNDENFVTLSL